MAPMKRSLADDETLLRHVTTVRVLAEAHGLTELGLGDDPGEIVATVAPGRTYFDLARFEMEAIAVLGVEVHVTPSSAPGAHVRAALTPPVAA